MTLWLADTSVVVPAIVLSHQQHDSVNRSLGRRVVRLTFHAALEAYSVLTRLPGDARLSPVGDAVFLREARSRSLVDEFASFRIAGGAVYDALIAATAEAAGATLLTRDRRAAATYEQLKVAHEFVG